MNSINVVLTTTSPWYVAYPDNQKKEDGKNVSLTQKKVVFGEQVPCYLGNGFRGFFRRSMANRIIDILKSRGDKIPADVFIGLQTGSASANPDSSPHSVEELVRSSRHVYMGLFGGGARTLRSRYSVSDITPILHSTVESGEIIAPNGMVDEVLDGLTYEKTEEDGSRVVKNVRGWNLTEERSFTKVDDFESGNLKASDLEVIESGSEGVSAYLLKNAENSESRKTSKKASKKEDKVTKTSVKNLLSFETIKTGVKMHFRIDFDPSVTEAQFGGLMLALESWVHNNYVGGWGRTGFGRFKIDAVRIDSDRFNINENYVNGDLYENGVFTLANMAPDIQSHISECIRETEAIDTSEIISYFYHLKKEVA